MTAGALPQPPQPPVALPSDVLHGTWRAHRKFKCRCRRCQEYSRSIDRNRPPRGKNRPRTPDPDTGWYVCANKWGATFAEHEYSRIGKCIRCRAVKTTEDFWERKWQSWTSSSSDSASGSPSTR